MEFYPVIMAAGSGSRMNGLTSDGLCKCLLPIANKALIWYVVAEVEAAKFEEALIIVRQGNKNDAFRVLITESNFCIKLNFAEIPDNCDWGTAESLKFVAPHLTSALNILVISGDTITDFPLQHLLNAHRMEDADVSVLACEGHSESSTPFIGCKKMKSFERDIFAICQCHSRLLFLGSESDFDERISLSSERIQHHARIYLSLSLIDAHTYIFKKCILDYLVAANNDKSNKHISSIKGDFIAHLLQHPFESDMHKFHDKRRDELDSSDPFDIYDFQQKGEDVYFSSEKRKDESPKLFVCVANQSASLRDSTLPTHKPYACVRVNTYSNFVLANKLMLNKHFTFDETFKSTASSRKIEDQDLSEDHSANVSHFSRLSLSEAARRTSDSLISTSVKLGKSVCIKKSIIGDHCIIGDNCKIINSILASHIIVKESSCITNSVLMPSCEIGQNCDVKDSFFAQAQVLSDKKKVKNEALMEHESLF